MLEKHVCMNHNLGTCCTRNFKTSLLRSLRCISLRTLSQAVVAATAAALSQKSGRQGCALKLRMPVPPVDLRQVSRVFALHHSTPLYTTLHT